MNQTLVSKEESPLFDNAISKLQPRAFLHPVWIRFGYIEDSYPYDATIKSLQAEIENLWKDLPSDACQVLLLCAVFQHYSGQSAEALATIQVANNLADRNDLKQEIMWALWGSSAICIQEKKFEQAINYLTSLIRLLRDQNDWILASFVEEVKQSLQQSDTSGQLSLSKSLENQPPGSLLDRTFHWLNHWGYSDLDPDKNIHKGSEWNGPIENQPLLSWRSLRLLYKGELKINWLGFHPQPGKIRFSLWGFIQSMLHMKITSEVDEPETSNFATTPTERVEVHLPEDRFLGITGNQQIDANSAESLTETSSTFSEALPNIPISVHMLGNFNVTMQDKNLKLPSSRGQSLFKYLLLHHKQNTTREVLMEIFWPNSNPETARNNLNVAIHSIRQSLRTFIFLPVIVFKDGAYGFESNVEIWLDVDEFKRCVKSGQLHEVRNQRAAAIAEYEAAVSLYRGDFLEQNPYEEWTILDREQLRVVYLETLDRLSQIYFEQERYAMCITACKLILIHDRCREDAHSLLMRCYHRQGQNHLALHQYHICFESLHSELDVEPAQETTELYERIRLREYV